MILNIRKRSQRGRQAPPARVSTFRKVAIWVAAAAVLAVVVVVCIKVGQALITRSHTCDRNGATTVMKGRLSRTCVGVSDGAYTFQFATGGQQDGLARLEKKIAVENQKARSSGTYVSVVYLMPAPGSIEPVQTFINQLEGAYAAQVADNGSSPLDGGGPPIQLLIASSGPDAADYAQVDQIIADDVASQHVAAVAGIAISRANTVAEVWDLTKKHGIPVVGSTITASEFDNIPGLVRVAPSSSQEIDAVFTYNKAWTHNAYLLEDTNPTDSYSLTLAREFKKDVPHGGLVADVPYNTNSGGDTRQFMSDIKNDVCQGDPPILFAGRGRDLGVLISVLAQRDCLNTPVTIVTGTDIVNMSVTHQVRQGLASNVTVDYAGLEHPNGLSTLGRVSVPGEDQNRIDAARRGYTTFTAAYGAALGTAVPSDENAAENVAMAFDAMRTSIAVIRHAGDGRVPRPGAVSEFFPVIRGGDTVYGASGPIVLSGNYTTGHGSNPVGKALPILYMSRVSGFKKVVQTSAQP